MKNIAKPKNAREIWYLRNTKTGTITIDKYYVLADVIANILLAETYDPDDLEFRKATHEEIDIYKRDVHR